MTTSLSKIRKALAVSIDEERFTVPAVELPQANHLQTEYAGEQSPDNDEVNRRVQERLQQAEVQYQERLREAQEQAQTILQAAQHEAEELRLQAIQQGREDGYTTGYQEGLEACQTTCDDLLRRAQGIVQEAQEQRGVLLRSMVEPLTQVAVEAVTVLLRRDLELAPANVEQLVNDLLQYVMESSSVEIRVHPDDYTTATAAHPKWMAAKFGEWDVAIVPDPGVQLGGCEIRSSYGRIDARVETRIELLQEHLQRIVDEEVRRRVG